MAAADRKTITLDATERLELWDAIESITEAQSTRLFHGNSNSKVATTERLAAVTRVRDYIAVADELGWERGEDCGGAEIKVSDALRRLLPVAIEKTEQAISEDGITSLEVQLSILKDIRQQVERIDEALDQFPGNWSDDPEIAALEQEGVIELAAIGRDYAVKLPSASIWRETFIKVGGMDATRSIIATERRMAVTEGAEV